MIDWILPEPPSIDRREASCGGLLPSSQKLEISSRDEGGSAVQGAVLNLYLTDFLTSENINRGVVEYHRTVPETYQVRRGHAYFCCCVIGMSAVGHVGGSWSTF